LKTEQRTIFRSYQQQSSPLQTIRNSVRACASGMVFFVCFLFQCCATLTPFCGSNSPMKMILDLERQNSGLSHCSSNGEFIFNNEVITTRFLFIPVQPIGLYCFFLNCCCLDIFIGAPFLYLLYAIAYAISMLSVYLCL
jgi:hypothetical protein